MKRVAALLAPVLLITGLAIFQASPASAAYTTNAATLCVQLNHGGNSANGTVAACGWIRQIRDSNTGQVRGTVGVLSAEDQGGGVDAIQINSDHEGVYGGPAFSGQVNDNEVHSDTSGCTFCGPTMKSDTSDLWANTVGVFDSIGGGVWARGTVSVRWGDGQLGTYDIQSNISYTYRCAGSSTSLYDCGSSSFSINP